jgi:hypothetical protein
MSLRVIEPPSKELLEKLWSELGLNEQRVREAVELLKDWIQLQPHLPKEIGTFGKDKIDSTTLFITVNTRAQPGACDKVLEFIYFVTRCS